MKHVKNLSLLSLVLLVALIALALGCLQYAQEHPALPVMTHDALSSVGGNPASPDASGSGGAIQPAAAPSLRTGFATPLANSFDCVNCHEGTPTIFAAMPDPHATSGEARAEAPQHSRGMLALCALLALGTVAVAPVNATERPDKYVSLPMAAATLIYEGVLVCLDSSGRAVNAADTAGLRVIGRAEVTADNSAGSAGDIALPVKRGCFKYANSGTNAIAATDVGKLAYVEDNQTVAITSTNKVVAGRIVEVATDGVWVDPRLVSPTAKPTASALPGAVATTASTATTPYGYTTQAQADALVAQVNALRAAVLELQANAVV